MLTVQSLAASALACALLVTLPPQVVADYAVKADSATTVLDKWEGWGTSLCWWANAFGDREDVADVFFTRKETVTLDGATLGIPALGFDIARYNIGG